MLKYLPDNKVVNAIVSAIIFLKFAILDRFYLNVGRLTDNSSKSNPGLVSVLIPTYNRCQIILERALPSILAQTYQNFEIVIVDDGSSDNTYDTIKALNNPKINVIRNSRKSYRYPNKALYHWFTGGVSALNKGLPHCKGEYVARIDDDDIWTKDHLEKLLIFLKETKSEFVYSHILAKMSNTGEEEVITNVPDRLGNTCTWFFKSYLKNFKINIHCWRKVHNRVFDVDVHNRMFQAGVKIHYLEEVTAIYLPRPGEEFAGSQAYIQNSLKVEETHKI
ncbi:MAG: glycosyltransferase family 2 protein [Bacteroidetes bacterium]|nr:glycosyltransferase family 2 protein [Bacteroidota bacterium]